MQHAAQFLFCAVRSPEDNNLHNSTEYEKEDSIF